VEERSQVAKDIQDKVGQFLGSDGGKQLMGTAVSEILGGLGSNKSKSLGGHGHRDGNGGGALSGAKGLAAGAGAAALAPMAVKGIGKLINGGGSLASGPKGLAEGAASKLGDSVGDKVSSKIDDAGGPSGILKDTVKSALPFGGGGKSGGGKQDTEGVGKGRRMPIQQAVDVALPIETVYNQWTQFEEWPKFMHRVTRASQEDACKVNFSVKIWGKTKEFTADIETQRPDDRIKWKTSQGMNLTGTVAFRELAPNLTRILLSFDVAPGSLVEKYARGTRHVKRAARADLHRFVAFIEMLENETGAWRGVIEEGELVEDHDPSYDEQREYGSADELVHGRGSDDDEDSDDDGDDEEEESDQRQEKRSRGRNGGDPGERRSRSGGRQASSQRKSSGSRQGAQARRSSSSRSTSGSGSSGRSSSGRSSGGSSSGRSSSGRSSGSSSGRSSSGRSSGRSSSGRSGSGGTTGRASSRRGSGSSSSGGSSSRSKSGSSRSKSGSSRTKSGSSGSSGGSSAARRSRG
jgi:uncharacterized membrane protein